MLLAELVCLSNQAQMYNGALLSGGLLYVYYKGRTALATTYKDPNGNVENSNPIVLDNMGRCSVYASPNYSYTLVWCDKYGQEVFSYDKELLDAVPVEDTYSIGIKGDDTISVNQSLSGQTVVFNLHAKGEDYAGIDPIVVNNDTREISANHKPLGVEAPLKFVQDDEEATIIGVDSDSFTSAVGQIVEPIVESAISAVSGQFVYSAGDYIDITNNVISVTGDVGKTYSAGDNIDITDEVISGKDWSEEILSATSGLQPVSSMTAYQTVEDMSAYQPSGDYQPAGDYLTASASGNFYPMTGNPSGFISEVPDTYLQNSDLSTTDGKVTAISGIPLAAGGSAGCNVAVYTDAALPDSTQLDADLAAGKAICIIYDGHNFWFAGKSGGSYFFYSSSGSSPWMFYLRYYSASNQWIFGTYFLAEKNWVTTQITSAVEPKLDSSAFSSVSGDFLQPGDLNNYYTKEETNTYVNSAVDSATSGKQETLSAGDNIQISDNVISVTGELGKIYSGENHIVVDNTNDKIGLDQTALDAISSFNGEFDLSAGNNIAFRLEGSTVYIDGAEPGSLTYTPIIEDI